jgi:hypothetical protein
VKFPLCKKCDNSRTVDGYLRCFEITADPARMPTSKWPAKFFQSEIYQCQFYIRKKQMKRKVIQIQCSESALDFQTCTGALYALCDDGTIYFRADPWKEDSKWVEIPPPGGDQ